MTGGWTRACAVGAVLVCVVAPAASPLHAAERYALIVAGASGGPEYAEKYDGWRSAFVTILNDGLAMPPAHIVSLGEAADEAGRSATREHVRAVLRDLAKRTTKEDVLLVFLIGHGTSGDGADGAIAAKFNLVGPDLSAEEWAALLRPISARVIFVNGASGSYPFLETIAGRNRVVMTAADSPAQEFETVFPGMFIEAFEGARGDTNKDGRVSAWEAFVYAGAGVRDWFEERGQLATERPLLDDTGDGVGAEVPEGGASPADGELARNTFLQGDAAAPVPTGPVGAGLLERRAALTAAIDALRAKKGSLPADEYDRQLEALLLELATLDRELRR